MILCNGTCNDIQTSLTFMLLCVPLPVWKTTRGKWSSNLPEITLVQIRSTSKKVGRLLTYFICSFLDGVADHGVQTITDIDNRGSLFENTKSFDKRCRKPFSLTTYIKILQRPNITVADDGRILTENTYRWVCAPQ